MEGSSSVPKRLPESFPPNSAIDYAASAYANAGV